MKRYIRLVALCMALLSLITAPASAAESTNLDGWLNLLDYDTANSSGSNTVSCPSGTTSILYMLPAEMWLGFIDAVIFSNHSFTATNGAGTALTVSYIGNNLYRVYGSCPNYTIAGLSLKITVTSATVVEVKSLRVCTVYGSSHFAEKGTLRVTGGGLSSTYSATQSSSTTSLKCSFPVGLEENQYFNANIYLTGWRNYDYLDFYFFVRARSIESIVCKMGDVFIPVDIQFYSVGIESGVFSQIVARVDLRGLDRSSSSTPVLFVEGVASCAQTDSSYGSYIRLDTVSGYVCPEAVDPTVSWIQKLTDKLTGWFSDLQSRVDIIGSQLVVNLNTITNSIKTEVKNITDRLDSLIHPDSTDSDDFSDSMASQATEMDEANDTLDSVTKPPVDDLDPSVDDIVPAEDVAKFTSVFAAIFENNIFLSVFLMSFTLAMVSYVLYGKR